MLSLFPMYYWVILAAAAGGRVIAGQLITYRLHKLAKDERFSHLVATVSSSKFTWFMRLSGVEHLLIVSGIVVMFYLTYEFIVPINTNSAIFLRIVWFIGYSLVTVQLVTAILSFISVILLIRK